MGKRTGIPQEQEIPAPVTTMILLDFATARERSARVRRVEGSEWRESRWRETVIVVVSAVLLVVAVQHKVASDHVTGRV